MKRSPQDSLYLEAYEVIRQLEAHGYEAYLVGGCVRDILLDRPVHDVDIATSAEPARVASLFERVIPTGIAHGTVTVVMPTYTYEVTTFRSEEGYADYRRPSEVHYITDLIEDLRRRDYTMNAIAMDRHGQLHDPFHGEADLNKGLIRAVGVAEDRFAEDALRMLRGIRFASVLKMRIAKSVWRGIKVKKPLLQHIAMERVRDELWKLTEGPDPAKGWSMLLRSGVLSYAKEPLRIAAEPDGPAWLPVYGALGHVETPELRFALIALGIGATEEDAAQDARALRLSKAQQDAIISVLGAYARLEEAAAAYMAASSSEHDAKAEHAPLRRAVAQAVLRYGENAVRGALRCSRALAHAAAAAGERGKQEPKSRSCGLANSRIATLKPSYCSEVMQLLNNMASSWIDAMPVKKLSELHVNGKQLLQLTDQPAGAWVRECLEHVFLEAALGTVDPLPTSQKQSAKLWMVQHLHAK